MYVVALLPDIQLESSTGYIPREGLVCLTLLEGPMYDE